MFIGGKPVHFYQILFILKNIKLQVLTTSLGTWMYEECNCTRYFFIIKKEIDISTINL